MSAKRKAGLSCWIGSMMKVSVSPRRSASAARAEAHAHNDYRFYDGKVIKISQSLRKLSFAGTRDDHFYHLHEPEMRYLFNTQSRLSNILHCTTIDVRADKAQKKKDS